MGSVSKVVWAILIIFSAVIIFLASVIGYASYKGYQLVQAIKESSIKEDFEEVMNGNCEKIDSLESGINQLKEKAESPCRNFIIRWVISKSDFNLCSELDNGSESINQEIQKAKSACPSA